MPKDSRVEGGAEKWGSLIFFFFCLCYFPSWQTGNSEMGIHLAPELCLVLHGPQLQQTPLGEVVYGDFRFLHIVDRSLLLHDGLDGESRTLCNVPSLQRKALPSRGEQGWGFRMSQLLPQYTV